MVIGHVLPKTQRCKFWENLQMYYPLPVVEMRPQRPGGYQSKEHVVETCHVVLAIACPFAVNIALRTNSARLSKQSAEQVQCHPAHACASAAVTASQSGLTFPGESICRAGNWHAMFFSGCRLQAMWSELDYNSLLPLELTYSYCGCTQRCQLVPFSNCGCTQLRSKWGVWTVSNDVHYFQVDPPP